MTDIKSILDAIQAIEHCKQWEAISIVSQVMGRSSGSVNNWLYKGTNQDTIDLLRYRLAERYPTLNL